MNKFEARKQEIAAELGLDKLPSARMDMPDEQKPVPTGFMIKWKKAASLIDPIETAAFGKYIPDGCAIDQGMDARSPSASRDENWAINCRTDQEIPSNLRVVRSTGIGSIPNANNHYLWLANELDAAYKVSGARAMSPPLVFRTNGHENTVPLLGILVRWNLTPQDGQTKADLKKFGWAMLGEKKTAKVDEEMAEALTKR